MNKEPKFPASKIPEGCDVIYRGLAWRSGKTDIFYAGTHAVTANPDNFPPIKGKAALGFPHLHYWEIVPKKEPVTPEITEAYRAGSYNAYWLAFYDKFKKPPTVTHDEFNAYVSKKHCEESEHFPTRTFEEFQKNEAQQFPSNPEEDKPKTKTKTKTNTTIMANYSNKVVATPTLIFGKDVKDFTESEALNQVELLQKKIDRLQSIPGAADALSGKIKSFKKAQELLIEGLADDEDEEVAAPRPLVTNG